VRVDKERREYMNRTEKRRIRQKIHNLLDTKCKGCEFNGKNQNGICNTICPVGAKMRSLSEVLFQNTEKQPSMFNESLVLEGYTRKPWTVEEDFYLLNHFHLFSCEHLSKKFARTPVAVKHRYNTLIRKQKKEAAR
jgi:hypothetical protein